MRRLKNKYVIGSLLGSVTGFLFALVDDLTFHDVEERRGKRGARLHKPDPNAWAVWAIIGGVTGVVMAFALPLPQFLRRHLKLAAAGTLGVVMLRNVVVMRGVDSVEGRLSSGMSSALGTRPGWDSPRLLPAAADDTMGIGASK